MGCLATGSSRMVICQHRFWAVYDGYYGDAALTYSVGDINKKTEKLLSVTEESLYEGMGKQKKATGSMIFRTPSRHVSKRQVFSGEGVRRARYWKKSPRGTTNSQLRRKRYRDQTGKRYGFCH